MAQSTPNAPVQERRSSSGYAGAFDGKVWFGSAVAPGAVGSDAVQSFTTSGSDNDVPTLDDDTVVLAVDTSSNSKTAQVELDSIEGDGRMLFVYDSGGAAGTDGIDIVDSSDTSVYNITTNNEGAWLKEVADGTWYAWSSDGSS